MLFIRLSWYIDKPINTEKEKKNKTTTKNAESLTKRNFVFCLRLLNISQIKKIYKIKRKEVITRREIIYTTNI